MRSEHQGSGPRTFGVEEEMLLVDRDTFRLSPGALPTLAAHLADDSRRTWDVIGIPATSPGADAAGPLPAEPPALQPELTFEVKEEQLEIVSPPAARMTDLEASIRDGRRIAARAALAANSAIAAIGASPYLKQAHVVPQPRYQRMAERFGLIMREQLTCGFHVHVAVADQEEGVAVLDRIRGWLPVILALSANSPFWHDQDSGFASFRYQVWGRWPTTGPTQLFGSAAGYRERVVALLDSGVPMDEGMLYFDARFSARVPTVEVRVADIVADPGDAATIAALVRALVEHAIQDWRRGTPPDPVSGEVVRVWMYQASLAGIRSELVDPETRRVASANDVVARLIAHVRPTLEDLGEYDQVAAGVQRILARGTGADLQRSTFAQTRSLTAVVADAVRRTGGGGAADVVESA